MSPSRESEFLTGERLARRYDLTTLLGVGGMGEVYLARDRSRDGRTVAVKILKDAETISWFKQEFETLSLMAHPHIARVFDFDRDRDRDVAFYTCEYVPGRAADEALKGADFPVRLAVFVQVLRALQYIHSQGYLHCDMKPKNVLVTAVPEAPGYFARVLDFGLAMAVPRAAMTARGTFSYMAPEWFEGGVPGPYTDIYSTGIMFYEATYGELPFVASDADSCIAFHTRGEMAFPERPDVPDWWRQVLVGMTTKEIADRYRSVREVLAAVNRLGGCDFPLHASEDAGSEGGIGGPWLGRQEALAEVMEGLSALWRGDPTVAAFYEVKGEHGVGKSRFLAEVKRRTQLAGHRVVHLANGDFATLAAQVREQAVGDESTPLQERIAHMVTRLANQVLESARTQPLLFLVDEAHLLDEHAARLLETLANAVSYARREQTPLPLVGALLVRGPDAALPPALAGHELSSPVSIAPLQRPEIGRLLRLALGLSELPSELEDEAWSVCRGNPRMLLELAIFLRDCGCLVITPRGVNFRRDRLPKGGFPGDIQTFVQQAWQNLGPQDRKLLSVLSVLFEPQPLPVLATATDLEVWQVDEIVLNLAERCLLDFETVRDRALPAVPSDTLRSLFARDLGGPGQRALHAALAGAIEALPGPPEAKAGALAWHLFHSGAPERAAPLALTGARQALAEVRPAAAEQLADVARRAGADLLECARLLADIYRSRGHYEAGVGALQEILAKATPAQTADVTLLLCDLYFRSGQYREAVSLLTPLAADEAGLAHGPALALLARVTFFQGDHARSRQTGEQGMLVLPSESRDFAICAAMVGLVRVYEGRLQQGAKYLETAAEVLHEQGTGSDRAFAANAVGLAYHKLKDYPRAQEHYQRSLEVALATGDSERINIASMNLSVLAQEVGDYAQAISRYEQAEAMAYQAGNLPALAKVYNNLGNIHRYLGMLQKARDFAQRSIDLADRLELGLPRGHNRLLLGEILSLQGQLDEAAVQFAAARAIFAEAQAADETLECAIDEVELAIGRQAWAAAAEQGMTAVERARELELDNHRLRALLATAAALLSGETAEGPGQAAELLDEAAGLLDEGGAEELTFRHWALRTRAYTALGLPEKAAHALHRAQHSLARVREQIPADVQSVFFKRADRKRLLADFSRVSSRMAELAQTISPSMPSIGLHRQHQRWLRELIRMNERLAAEHDLEKLLETLIDVVVDLSGAERGFVLLEGESALDVVVARNMDREAIRKSKGKFSTSIAHKVIESGQTVRLEDAIEADDFRTKRSVMALRIRSVICLPIASREEAIGAIYLDNRFKPGVFSEDVVEMLTAFAEQAAIAIATARLLIKYRESVTALERSREEVQRLNERLEEKVQFQRLVIEQKSEELDLRQQQLEARYQFDNIVGRSPAIEALFSIMRRVTRTHVPVLVTGASGAGKELVARALHFSGPRRKEPFLTINAAALPDSLLESELFGHEEGAFTDARKARKGLFSQADGGTLFLDEVGDMSLAMQAKLLRVLQEGELTPLGAEAVVKVDVRIIAATNRDLKVMVKKGTFRQDLYYRLDVVSIRVPTLRERKEDIPLLVEHFLDRFAEQAGGRRPKVSMQAMQVLMSYDWPGNVRELHSVVTTSAVFAESGVISLESLRTKPEVFGGTPYAAAARSNLETLNLKELEKQAVIGALVKAEGNKQQAARILGISRRALYNKLAAHSIDLERPK